MYKPVVEALDLIARDPLVYPGLLAGWRLQAHLLEVVGPTIRRLNQLPVTILISIYCISYYSKYVQTVPFSLICHQTYVKNMAAHQTSQSTPCNNFNINLFYILL